jgi:carboxylate-amine ligase
VHTTFGIEEEFMLLEPVTLRPVDAARLAMTAMSRAGSRGTATAEFFASQVEHPSPVFTTMTEASDALRAFRAGLCAAAGDLGLLAGGVGAPFDLAADAALTDEPRYREIASHFGAIVPDHQINGLHVHVGVPSRDAAVSAMNVLRPWLPTLLALSANSPFWRGADTGFDSWRAIHGRRWTTFGVPPRFTDAADYDARTAALRGVGGTSDAGTLNWVARPSERFPTVEVRVFDAQLDARTSVALAALVRGLVGSGGLVDSGAGGELLAEQELLDAALWHAARDGLGGELVDPRTGTLRPAATVVEALVERAGAGLERHGDTAEVAAVIADVLAEGNGATRQRRAFASDGVAGLAELVRSSGAAVATTTHRA